ncbi:DUF3530 family protein [Shewanella dokdonensis]|uniref:DUF3530 family protein n=1 Tax=Shewanella dokdonensis TaxID=712036 RepID=A0ABX8DHC9_9GAMM|nr:DUF3530 family protein [Shewanella dokdonensis]MCL1075807.1 alpha/beta hydrolase family protein [Shewanella dokdonensis]QVK24153.1 DUF3530 family protein [Shewanella dokdonensis]
MLKFIRVLLPSMFACGLFTTTTVLATPTSDAEQQTSQIQIEGKPVTVLTREWQYRIHRGSAIFIPAPGENAMSPGLLEYLRQQLNLLGWTTISFTPPPQPAEPNFTTEASEISKAGDGKVQDSGNNGTRKRSDDAWQQLQQTQQAYLQQALTQLQTSAQAFAGKKLLIAAGSSAALVLNLLKNNNIMAPDLLVLINPYAEEVAANAQLPKLLADLPLAVLDLQSPDANSASLATQSQRQQVYDSHPGYHSRQRLLALNSTQSTAYDVCLHLINQMGSGVVATTDENATKAVSP